MIIITRYCSNCGTKIREDGVFCEGCGRKIISDNEKKLQMTKEIEQEIIARLENKIRKEIEQEKSSKKKYMTLKFNGYDIAVISLLTVLILLLVIGKLLGAL